MNLIFLALPILAANPFLQSFQDSDVNELRFHRIHLTNGNFIDGQMIKDSPSLVLLRIRSGEMGIRRDQIDRVEFIKMRDRRLPPAVTEKKDPVIKDPVKDPIKTPEVQTPEVIRKKVEVMIWKLKTTPGTDKAFNARELLALGEEGAAYLASRTPEMDLDMQNAVMSALIVQKQPYPKLIAVLENLLSHNTPSIRGLALTVLTAEAGEPERQRYLRPALRDPDPGVRIVAVSSLVSVEGRDWFEPVSELCGDADKNVRNRAMPIARKLATKHGLQEIFVRALVQNLTSATEGVRTDSAANIGALGVKESWTHLVPVLNDPEPTVRAAAAQALMQLGAPDSGDDIASAMTREQDRFTRLHLAAAAQKLRVMKAAEPLIDWLTDPDAEIQKVAENSLRVITGQPYGKDRAKWLTWLQSRVK